MTLVGDLAPVAESIMPLLIPIDDLMMTEDPFGVNTALIADYFSVNDAQIRIDGDSLDLANFCVAGGSVLKFDMSYSLSAED